MRFPVPSIPRAFRRRPVVIGVVAVLLAGAIGGWLVLRKPAAASATTTTTTVTRGTVKQTVAASGTLAAAHSDDDSFTVSGTVTKVYVSAGDRVRKGQRLARIDDESLVATRTAAASSLTAAYAQLKADRTADASDVQIASDEASISSAEAALTQADDAVDEAVLRASIAGTVTSVGISVGDAVGGSAGSTSSSTSGSSSSSSAISIVSGNHYVLDADLSAADATSVKKGMQASLTVTGVDTPVYGTVRSVSLVAETGDSGAAVFPVVIEVTGARKDLYAGVSADATITVKVRQNVLTVSTQAVHSDTSGTYVDKLVNGTAVRTAVEVGSTYGMQTEITSGLKEGDTVEVASFRLPSGAGGNSDQQQRMHQMMQNGGGFPAGGGAFPGGGQ